MPITRGSNGRNRAVISANDDIDAADLASGTVILGRSNVIGQINDEPSARDPITVLSQFKPIDFFWPEQG